MIDMNKQKIIKFLEQYNLDKNEYYILSGASLVLQNIKENTNDIDIAVTKKLEQYLLKNYECCIEKITDDNVKVYFIDNILNFSTNLYNSQEIIMYENYPVQSLESIIKLKRKFNRDKDINDIKLIEKYIKE